MTDYTALSNTAVGVGGLPSGATVTALRDNPIAIAEGAAGSPVVLFGWHPHDMVSAGDGSTGIVWDGSVDADVSSVETPVFVDGYEYLIICNGLQRAGGSTTGLSITLELFFQTTGAYSSPIVLMLDILPTGTYYLNSYIEVIRPRDVSKIHLINATTGHWTGTGDGITASAIGGGALKNAAAQKISKARIKMSAAFSFNVGSIAVMKRKLYG